MERGRRDGSERQGENRRRCEHPHTRRGEGTHWGRPLAGTLRVRPYDPAQVLPEKALGVPSASCGSGILVDGALSAASGNPLNYPSLLTFEKSFNLTNRHPSATFLFRILTGGPCFRPSATG